MVSSEVLAFDQAGSLVNSDHPLPIKISASTDADSVKIMSSYSRHKDSWTSYSTIGSGSKFTDGYWYKSFTAPSGAAHYRFYSQASSATAEESAPGGGYDQEYAVYYNCTGNINKGFTYVSLPVKNNWNGVSDMAYYFNKAAMQTYDERQIESIYTRPHPDFRHLQYKYPTRYWHAIYNVHPVDAIPDSNKEFNNYDANPLLLYKFYSKGGFSYAYSGALLEHNSISTMLYSGSRMMVTSPHYDDYNISSMFCSGFSVLKIGEYDSASDTWKPEYFCGSDVTAGDVSFGAYLFPFKLSSQADEWWDAHL